MKANLPPLRRSSLEPLELRIAPASTILNVAALDGTNGSRISGVSVLDEAGFSVSHAGDINGDGFDDILIGARYADPTAISTGVAYVVFGSAAGLPADFSLSMLNGMNGFAIRGETDLDQTGFSVSAAGDVNNDTFDDIIIGAPTRDSNGISSGSSYVIFGKDTGFSAVLNLSALTGPNGFEITGAVAGEKSGTSVSGAGDINGDGFDDLVIGAPARLFGADANGAAYVVFGKAAFGATFALAGMAAADGFTILGDEGNAGTSVSGAGDVNGDTFADMIIGAPGANSTRGVSYIIFGKLESFGTSLNLSTLSSSAGVKLNGLATGNFAGGAVADAGDVNGDGLDDVLVGATGAKPRGELSGTVYVVFGRPVFSSTLSLGSLNGSNGFRIGGAGLNDQAGFSVSSAGDFNKDGRDDLLIGAPDRTDALFNPDPMPGDAFLLYGKSSFRSLINLFGFRSTDGIRIAGQDGLDKLGFSVSTAGDFNGDGVTDILLGAPGVEHDNTDTNAGAAYVIYGEDFAALRFATNGRSATFGDADGDLVTVRTTKGTLDASNFVLVPAPGGIGFIFQKLDLTAAEFKDAIVSVSAQKLSGGTGDTVVNLGYLDSTGHDLSSFTIDGDLGQIDVGETVLTPLAIRTLSVGSLGTRTDTQPPATPDPLHSEITGSLSLFKSARNVEGILDVSTSLGTVSISGDLDGTAGGSEAGLIRGGTNIGRVVVRGDVLGGATLSGVLSGGKLGLVTINHDLMSADPTKPVLITALGKIGAVSQRDTTAMAGLSILGNVLNAQILAGFDLTQTAMNGDAAIGKVGVRGNWEASDLVAGGLDVTANGFGRNDTLNPGHNPALIARIASISIRGTAIGSAAPGDHFGLVAEQIVKASITRVALPVTAGTDDILIDTTNNDFRLHEVV